MESIAIILIVIGILLLIAEIFIPSFGITGIVGIAAIIGGVVLTSDTIMGGILLFSVILVISIVLMVLSYKIFASKRSPLILNASVKDDTSDDQKKVFVGKNGVALTPLRPAGTADVEGVRLDVMTQGEYIEKGNNIKVVSVKGKKIFVKLAK